MKTLRKTCFNIVKLDPKSVRTFGVTVCLSFLLVFPGTSKAQADSIPVDSIQTDTVVVSIGDSIVHFAQSFLGTTYLYGSKDPNIGFDCSGFCYHVFTQSGVKVPRTSRGYDKVGIEIPIDSVQPGDLLLFRGTDPNIQTVGHIGIVISRPGETLRFIHSSSSKKHYGVVITVYHQSGYPKRFLRAKRIL